MARTVVGLFEDQNDAQSAMRDLQSAGFSSSNATLVTNASSGLLNALTSAGIPQEDATIYSQGVQSGGSLIILQALPNDQANQAASILDRYNVVDISQRGRVSQQTTTTRTSSGRTGYTNDYEGGDMVIPIVEETISVGKREVESGGVRVNVDVEEVPVNEQVTLREEHVNVQRRPVDQAVDPSQIDQLVREGSFEMHERSEEAVVQKEARVVEEVVINKEAEQRTETIQDTVRRTDVDVEQTPGQTRTTGYTETTSGRSSGSTMTSGSTGEGASESGASRLGNAVERATGLDIDQDNDVGQRDTRNNY